MTRPRFTLRALLAMLLGCALLAALLAAHMRPARRSPGGSIAATGWLRAHSGF